MSEKEIPDSKRFAEIMPIDAGIKDGSMYLELFGISTDRETMENAMLELADQVGANSWTIEELKSDGSKGNKQFFFSGATWKAPWQPKGPTPNWQTPANKAEPIN